MKSEKPSKKFEKGAAEAAKVELDQTLPCTSECHPHPPIGPLAWAVGVTGGERQNFADSITVVLVPQARQSMMAFFVTG